MFIATPKTFAHSNGLKYLSRPEKDHPQEYFWFLRQEKIEGQDYLFLINEESRFVVVLKKPEKNLTGAIKEAMKKTFLLCGLSRKAISNYFKCSGPFKYGESHSRKFITWLKMPVEKVKAEIEKILADGTEPDLAYLGANVSILPFPYYGTVGYFLPRAKMINTIFELESPEKFEEEKPSFGSIAEIESTLLNSESGIVTKRTFMTRTDLTFSEFAEILMEIYGFEGYHLYEFELSVISPTEPIKISVYEDPDEFYDEDSPLTLTYETEIAPYLVISPRMVFIYNFGDFWNIELKILHFFPGCMYMNDFLPCVLSLSGPNPLEDMGGMTGYDELIEYKLHPEKAEDPEEMEEFLEWVGDRDFDPNVKSDFPVVI